jgi:hypothetical protein
MADEFRDGPSEMVPADWNQAVEALFFNRSHEPFGVSIGIRRSHRRPHDTDPRVAEQLAHVPTPFSVAVAQ